MELTEIWISSETLEGIDQMQDSLRENIQDFSEGTPPPNKRFPEETECWNKCLDDKSKMLQHHFHLNHSLFRKLKAIETLWTIPRRLRNAQSPKCPACEFGIQKMTPWRKKGEHKHNRKFTTPVECVSLDIVQLRLTEFLSQSKENYKNLGYKGASIFVGS